MRRTTRISDSFATPSRRRRIFGRIGVLASAALIAALAGCSSGDGGDNGHGDMGDAPGVTNPGKAGGLTFTYPSDGQQDVYAQTQIALTFAGDVSDDADHLTLVAHPGQPNEQAVATDVTQDGSQPGIFRLQVAGQGNSVERPALQPDTKYAVEATGDIGAGNTQYKNGDTLFAFTTRPASNSPSPKGFTMVGHRGDSNDPFPFTAFNTIRLTLSEPVNPATAIKGDTVSVTDSGGMNVPGRMVADGRHISFDPNQNLKAGETYTVSLAKGNGGDAVQSIFGDALSGDHSFKLKPVSVGKSVKQNVVIEPTSNNAQSLPANNLNGGAANVVSLVSELVGRNMLPAQNDPQRRSLLTVLAGTTSGDRYNNTFPAIIPAGQEFNLTPLNLKLGGAITTPIQSGPLVARFIDAADVFITANSLRNVKTPTAVHLRFDVAIGSDIQGNDQNQIVANGAVNQTVMNVVASGLAVPQDNGDIKLTTLGSFPTAVNRNGKAITDFELELTLRAGSQDDIRNQPDSSQPFITAQYPSACLYTYGAQFNDFFMDTGLDSVPLESAENDCAANSPPTSFGPRGNGPAGIDDYLLGQNPSITFSEPIDPSSLTPHDSSHLRLTNPDGDAVAFTAHTEGSTVVLDPTQALAHDERYNIIVGDSVADLAGNTIASGSARTFRTAPYVMAEPPQSYQFEDQNGDTATASKGNIAQTAPFITAIQPGVPCALDPAGGDYLSGGATAGYCLGDQRDSSRPSAVFPVFKLPANQPVKVQFTKPVEAASIKLANSCLTGGGGSGSVAGASIAVQRMDGSGGCEGVVAGGLTLPQPNRALTRSLQFVPDKPWQTGQRYWLVICGDDHDQCSSSAATIIGRDDGNGLKYVNTNGDIVKADYSGDLNTNPLQGTGTRPSASTGSANFPSDAANGNAGLGAGFFPAEGGPDIIMPFDGAAATTHYSFLAKGLPLADVNGNGQFDGEGSTVKSGIPPNIQPQLEHSVPANAQYLNITGSLTRTFPTNVSVYQSGAVPNTVFPITRDCAPAAAIIGTTPSQCLPVSLSPGGMFELTALTPGGTQNVTSRILLRVAADQTQSGMVQDQTGYIVPECSGTINTGDSGERAYDYSPCFVLSLDLIASGPDGQNTPPFIQFMINQQLIHLDLVGSVSFERNGRLVLSLTNTNKAVLDDNTDIEFGESQPLVVTLKPGHSNIQLAGPPIHGGGE